MPETSSARCLALVLAEPAGAQVRMVLEAAAGDRLLVADLVWLEVTNVLARRQRWEPDAIVETLRELDELSIETVSFDRPLLIAALDLSARYAITTYDAAHLALAEATDARQLTLDDRLTRVAGPRSAIPPATGSSEDPASHEASPTGPDWTRHGRYLAHLRQTAGA